MTITIIMTFEIHFYDFFFSNRGNITLYLNYSLNTCENITDYSTSGRGEYFKQTLIIIFIQGNYYFLTKLTEQ
jgi:hypothetical protein